jgi:hypothetical protein
MLIYKVFYERVFLCFTNAENKEKAIEKAYLRYKLNRPEINKDKFTAKRSY